MLMSGQVWVWCLGFQVVANCLPSVSSPLHEEWVDANVGPVVLDLCYAGHNAVDLRRWVCVSWEGGGRLSALRKERSRVGERGWRRDGRRPGLGWSRDVDNREQVVVTFFWLRRCGIISDLTSLVDSRIALCLVLLRPARCDFLAFLHD